jgi:hypothetical protein
MMMIYILFNDAISISDCIASDGRMINNKLLIGYDFEGSGHGLYEGTSRHEKLRTAGHQVEI